MAHDSGIVCASPIVGFDLHDQYGDADLGGARRFQETGIQPDINPLLFKPHRGFESPFLEWPSRMAFFQQGQLASLAPPPRPFLPPAFLK